MEAVMARVSSAVMVADKGVTNNSVGAPAVTVTVCVPHTKPKQAETVWTPAVLGVYRPLEPMLPAEAYHSTGGL